MKLTPLDIHHKEFRHSLRGYTEEEVDQFLDEVADEFERLFKENIDLAERLEAATARISRVRDEGERSTTRSSPLRPPARRCAGRHRPKPTRVLRDAEIKAKEIIHNALARKQQVAAELVRIKQAEEEFRASFTALLDQQQRSISEVSLPEDVTVLLGETDEGVVGDVDVRPEPQAPAPAPGSTPSEVAPPAAPQETQASRPPRYPPSRLRRGSSRR